MPATPLEPGDIFAGYVVERQLGSGGMGEVYQVRHTELPKSFALKILPPALSNDASFAARFRRRMETVSRLDHPNIVMTTDGGSFNGQIWFTMTYVAGTDAQNAMGTPPSGLPAQHVAHIIDEISSALDYAHDQGVLHRDIKPANILLAGAGLTPNGRVFLTDFGIAKAIDDVRSITTTSQAPMTLDFASPEQINGKHLDRRTDVYSLGATLFALLTGSVPFPGIPEAKIHGHCTAAPPRPTTLKPGLTGAFDEVIRIAMAKDPRQRYQTCGQLASATRLAANTSLGVRTAVDATLTEQITSTLPTAIPRVRAGAPTVVARSCAADRSRRRPGRHGITAVGGLRSWNDDRRNG